MAEHNLKAALEALLFIYGEPTKLKKLAQVLHASTEEVEQALSEMKAGFESGDRGLNLVIHDDEAALVTKPELGEILKQVVKEELDAELTPASLETLSIVAYLGPCSRAEIDYIRGVNSSFILRSLMVRGLVEKKSGPGTGNSPLYQASFDFLRHVGVSSAADLPDYGKYHELVDKLRIANETDEVK